MGVIVDGTTDAVWAFVDMVQQNMVLQKMAVLYIDNGTAVAVNAIVDGTAVVGKNNLYGW